MRQCFSPRVEELESRLVPSTDSSGPYFPDETLPPPPPLPAPPPVPVVVEPYKY